MVLLEISDTSAPLPNVTAPGRNGGFSAPGGDEHLHPLRVTGVQEGQGRSAPIREPKLHYLGLDRLWLARATFPLVETTVPHKHPSFLCYMCNICYECSHESSIQILFMTIVARCFMSIQVTLIPSAIFQ